MPDTSDIEIEKLEKRIELLDQTRGNPPIVTGACTFKWEIITKCMVTEQTYCHVVLGGTFDSTKQKCPGRTPAGEPVKILPQATLGPAPTLKQLRYEVIRHFKDRANFNDEQTRLNEVKNAIGRVDEAIKKSSSPPKTGRG
jgi:hypothetical protein